ncbi:telomere-associated protein RIF1 isoform X2 [Lepisosteus oculatus]|uniref:telomere-associated protein RIF1 isoform X2 n=1 Tax=Lepisosteus oculatus TaxID=7918 RepID=UPI0035F5086F
MRYRERGATRMMATVHPNSSSLIPLLECLEDSSVPPTEQTDAYLTIANRLSGEDGRQFIPAVLKDVSRLSEVLKGHILSRNTELCQAALQALGYCVFHSSVVSGIPESKAEELLLALNTIAIKSADKNICTRALWVISKQNFSPELIGQKVPEILKMLEAVRAREDIQSAVVEHEALNVIIRLLEQAPVQMGEGAVRWAKLVVPLVVHSASKVRLRAAAALEMGMPLLVEKQQEVAAIAEPLMASLIPELQKLFLSKNESNVLKLWPLFVRLLGRSLHRGGPFINALLHLEELGFRSSSPVVKKIAFIAWKSLIDNFALNPDILCSTKRLKLLMQPLSSIQVKTEALTLTKLEVWWYLVVKLGPHLSTNFEQVGVPLVQSTISSDSVLPSPATPARNASNPNSTVGQATPKTGPHSFPGSAATPRMTLSSSVHLLPAYPSIQLLGLEMLLHFLLGPEVQAVSAQERLQLSLEPLTHPLLASTSFFCKHSGVIISAVKDGFVAIGKEAPDSLLILIWKYLIGFVTAAVETAGSKKERQGSEALTLLLQALQSIVSSEALPAHRTLGLLEATVKGIPQKILGSPAYQVANMDVLNGTPALFLILLFYHNSLLGSCLTDERFFLCLETLVSSGFSGPTSPLAFSESVLSVVHRSADRMTNKEHLWRMWSIIVTPLTQSIMQTNEVNQGDALEHNFTAVHSALMLPITHLLSVKGFPQMTMKSLLRTWSELYRTFARCSALVATVEENVCCEELCIKMASGLDKEALSNPSTLEAVVSILTVIIECVDFSPYTPKFQQKTKSPHTPLSWTRKKSRPLGNLSAFLTLLERCLQCLPPPPPQPGPEGAPAAAAGLAGLLSSLFGGLSLAAAIREALSRLVAPLAVFYEQSAKTQNDVPKFYSSLGLKLEKLLGEILTCLQTRYTMAYDDELLAQLAPWLSVVFLHKSKQVRNQVAQFWNSTFAKVPTLQYPQQLRSVLSQVKQKIPIILPGFEAVEVDDEFSTQDSDSSSQLDTKISGMEVKTAGKRDSMLTRAADLKESAAPSPKPVAVKLDFGSPKIPRREFLLEEEKSVDFVFIPPEPKERVLTEHQKEVLRTKRVDIPVMYNNLDASQDTTLFSQYSQSQEDSVDNKTTNEKAEDAPGQEVNCEVQEEKMEAEEVPAVHKLDPEVDKDDSSVPAEMGTAEEEAAEKGSQSDVGPSKSAALTLGGKATGEESAVETEETSANISSSSVSSEIVLATPQKNASRRQSFITLEKYNSQGKASSPAQDGTFTGSPVSGVSKSDSQEDTETQTEDQTPEQSPCPDVEEEASLEENGSQRQDCSKREKAQDVAEKEEEKPEAEHPGISPSVATEEEEDEDECIPDTQTEPLRSDGASSVAEEVRSGSEEDAKDEAPSAESKENTPPTEDSEEQQVETQSSQTLSSPSEPRRSSRRRSKPVRPGETSESPERDGKDKLNKRNLKGKESKSLERKSAEVLVGRSEEQKGSSSVSSQMETRSQVHTAKKSKATPEGEERVRRRTNSSAVAEAEASQGGEAEDGTQESSQGRGRYRTRRSSQGLLSSIENSESDGSESREESLKDRKTSKRGKPSKRVDAQVTEGPPKNEQTGRGSVESEKMDIGSELEKQNTSLLQASGPEISTDTSMACETSTQAEPEEISEEQAHKTDDVTAALDAETSAKASGSENDASLRDESQSAKTPVENCSAEPPSASQSAGRRPLLHVCSHGKRARGRKRFKSCNCRIVAALRQGHARKLGKEEPELAEKNKTFSAGDELISENGASNLDGAPRGEGVLSSDNSVFEPSDVSSPLCSNGPVLCATSTGDLNPAGESEEKSDRVAPEGLKEQESVESSVPGNESSVEPAERQGVEVDDEAKPDSIETLVEEVSGKQGDKERPDFQQTEQMPEEPELSVCEDGGVGPEDQKKLEEEGEEMMESNCIEAAEVPLNNATVDEGLIELFSVSKQTLETTCLDSPPKQKDCNTAVAEHEVGQSPTSAKPRGFWSPTASPSTSILKKGQKRTLEDDTPSPLHKTRRVSFANPIHQQELADDIDRRSPVIRTSSSSPRSRNSTSSALSSATQQKFVTTPTKALLSLSPRSLHSPGFKSSKKCLISEMGKEPKPIPKDCVFPALVSCTAPVEAVLPQLTSNMWQRGFGQLVRAKNIKTVGDLSALTPSEIKSLPIRSPKLSNVKKALKMYHEQQRKVSSDDLKGFDETEKMTSEPEEKEAPVSSEEKTATDVAGVPVPAVDAKPVDIMTAVQALGTRLTEEELGSLSARQLVLMHEQLSDMMKTIVVQLQSRVGTPLGQSSP